MSSRESSLPTETPDNPPPPPPAAAKKPRRWRITIIRILLAVIVVALAIRIAVFFALRPALRRVSEAYGVTITFDRQELTVVGGDVGLWGLKVCPKGTDKPLIVCDYVRGYVSAVELLRGNLKVLRAEADGVDVWLERTADGKIPSLQPILAALSTPPGAPPAKPTELDFSSPLKIEAFRLAHVRTKIHDAFVTPAMDALVWMDVRVNDLGMPGKPTKFDLDVWSDPGLELVRVSGEGTSAGRNLDATASVVMRGLSPSAFDRYLSPLGLRAGTEVLGGDLHAKLKAQPADDPSSQAVKVSLTLSDVGLMSDRKSVAAIKTVQVDAQDVDTTHATISTVQLAGGRLEADRNKAGNLEFAGIELVGAGPATRPGSSSAAPAASATPSAPLPYAITVRDISLRDMVAELHDEAVSPANDLKINLSELATKGTGSGTADSSIPVNATISMPGIAEAVAVKGSVKPFAQEKTLELEFSADQIKPDALRPYLGPFGVESLLNAGRAEGKLVAVLHPNGLADAHINGVKFTDGQDLLVMDDINIRGAGVDASRGGMVVDAIELTGPTIGVTRDKEGRLVAMGMRWTPQQTPTTAPASDKPAPAPATTQPVNLAFSLPRVRINNFSWKGLKAQLRDEQMQPPSVVDIGDAGVEAHNIVLGLNPSDTGATNGTFRAWLNSSTLAKQLEASGTLTYSANSFAADANTKGEGINTVWLAPYLKPFDVEPTLQDGSLAATAKLTIAQRGDATVASLDVTGAQLRDGQDELGGVDAFSVAEAQVTSSGLDVKSIRATKPRMRFVRDTKGVADVLGVRLLARPVIEAIKHPVVPRVPAIPIVASLGELKIEGSEIGFFDRGTRSGAEVQTTIRADLNLKGLVLGKAAPPATYDAKLAMDGVIDQFAASGTIDTQPDVISLQAQAEGKGIRAGTLAAYLPPGIEASAKDGRLKVSVDAGIKNVAPNGIASHLRIENLDWRDGDTPLASFSALKFTSPRIDADGNEIAIDEFSLADLQTQAQIDTDGSIHAAGLTIRSAPPQPPAPPAPAQPPAHLAAAVSGEKPAQQAETANQEDVTRLVAEARQPLPLFTLEKLDLGVRDITVRTLNLPNAAPISLKNTRVTNVSRIEIGGKDAGSRPPVQIECKGELSPLASAFAVHTSATPLAPEPALNIDLNAAGIRGSAITELFPQLASKIDGSGLTDGRFATKLEANVKFDRRGPRDFDLSRGFVLDLGVNGTEFRGSEGGPVLAALESLRTEQVKVTPKNGTVFAKSVEITNPALDAFRDKDGLHVLGIVVKLPGPATAPSGEETAAAPPATAPSLAEALPAAPAAPNPAAGAGSAPTGEVRIDRLTASGLKLRYQDKAVDPQLVVPLNNLDLEVRDFTTRALTEPRTIRFAALVNADKVPLPVKKGKGDELSKEDRELFSQVTTVGRLALYPRPNGYIKTALNGVELAAFQGIAHELGVTLQGGVLDGNIDTRFQDVGNLDAKSKFVFTDLKLSEPPGGPISKVLGLPPGGLDAALVAMQDPDGSITVPLPVQVKNGEISRGAIVGAAVGALSSVMATAVASAPVKVVAGAGQLVGLGGILGGGKGKPGPQPVTIQFAPGSTVIEPDAQQKLNQLLEQARRDKNMQLTIRHELGGGDVAIASERANPQVGDVTAMAEQLRQRKFELAAQRAQLAGQARAQLASLPPQQSQVSLARLRAIDIESAEVERSLDQLYDLLRPGADRQATRRTRAAALQMGTERLDGVAAILRAPDLPDAKDRVTTTGAQFNPADGDTGGTIVITPIVKKH